MLDIVMGVIVAGNALLGLAFVVYGVLSCFRARVPAEELERASVRSLSWPTPDEEEVRR